MMNYDESQELQRKISEIIDEINELAKGEPIAIGYYATVEALELAKRLCEQNSAPF